MASSINRVTLLGYLGADPVRRGQDGGFVTFSLATTRSWRDKQSGEITERTEWHDVTLYAEPAIKFATSYLHKGSRAYVEGGLETRSYDKDGEKRYATAVVVRPYSGCIIGLDGRSDAAHSDAEEPAPRPAAGRERRMSEVMDDDIPF